MGNNLRNEDYNENAEGMRPLWASADPTASGSAVELVPAPVAGFAIMILKYLVLNRSTTTGTITFLDNATQVTGIPLIELRTGGVVAVDNVGIKLTAAQALNYTSTLNAAHSIAVKYRYVPAT